MNSDHTFLIQFFFLIKKEIMVQNYSSNTYYQHKNFGHTILNLLLFKK